MIYHIIWDSQPRDFLKKLDNRDALRIINKINQIADNPYRYLEPLAGIKSFKLRIGKHRVLIGMNEKNKTMNILVIGHRKNIYKYIWKNK